MAPGATAARSLPGRAVPVLLTAHPSSLLRGAPEDREPAFAAFTGHLAQARQVFDRRAG